MNSSSTVSAELGLRLVVPQQTIVPLVASLYYSKEDPYAIRIAFHVGLDEPVEWIFARELLSRGIEGREGLGDVVVEINGRLRKAQYLRASLPGPGPRNGPGYPREAPGTAAAIGASPGPIR